LANQLSVIRLPPQKAKEAIQHAAETKAKLENAIQARANIEEQLNEITEFYSEIEQHESQMIEIQKNAESSRAKLSEEYSNQLKVFEEATQEIVDKNTELQGVIEEHLQKAVGASLFTVFDRRGALLSKGRKVWGWLLVAAVILVVGITLYVAYAAKGSIDVAFYIRLAVVAPCAFIIYFVASQYRHERRAEEEYAFKSAISMSLEPYRDLLIRMREDEEDTLASDFVKELMLEVFDNPAKRIYKSADASACAEIPTKVLKILVKEWDSPENKKFKESLIKLIKESIA
jgi:hypothetical protein